MAFSVFFVKDREKKDQANKKGTLIFRWGAWWDRMDKLTPYNINCRKTLGTFFNFKGHLLALSEGLKAGSGDGGMMDEHICAIFSLDETETFPVVEPFHCSLCHSANLLSSDFIAVTNLRLSLWSKEHPRMKPARLLAPGTLY
jgi:hypothetical protein